MPATDVHPTATPQPLMEEGTSEGTEDQTPTATTSMGDHAVPVVPAVVMPQTIHIIPQFVSSHFKTGFSLFPLINTKE